MTFPDYVLSPEFTREVREKLAPSGDLTVADCQLAMLVVEFQRPASRD